MKMKLVVIWFSSNFLKILGTQVAYLNYIIPQIEKNGRGQLMSFYATHYVNIKIRQIKVECSCFVDKKLILS